MRNLTIIGLATALAACGVQPANQADAVRDNGVDMADTGNAIDPDATPPVLDEEPADDRDDAPAPPAAASEPAPTPAPAPAPTPAPAPEGPADEADAPNALIPVALRGRWGLTPADCTSTRGDAKGLLRVTRDTLRFYESRATLGRITERDRSRIMAEFSFTGEGQTWTRRVLLDGQDRGRTLVRREYGADAMPGALRYRKCDA